MKTASTIKFLGTGGAFAPLEQGNSCMLITTASGKKMLFDCGTSLQYTLAGENLNPNYVDAIWISHQHADHIGSLEWFAFYRYFTTNINKTTLFIDDRLVDVLWKNSLSGGMNSVGGKRTDLNSFFNVRSGREFEYEELQFQSVEVPHVSIGPEVTVHSYGLYIQNRLTGMKTYITGDTHFCPYQVNKYYQEADQIFHDTETRAARSFAHANYEDLLTLHPKVKKKIFMYHYHEKIRWWERDGFGGFVDKGQQFEI